MAIIDFFPIRWFPTFVPSCEFNGLVSKSRRIPPVALFLFSTLRLLWQKLKQLISVSNVVTKVQSG